MKRIFHSAIAVALALIFAGCSEAGSGVHTKESKSTDGAKGMKTYYLGRFAIDLPVEFKLAAQEQMFRLVKIDECKWVTKESPERQREKKWRDRLTEIEQLRKPAGVKKSIIREEAVPGLGKWARAVLYYGDYMADDEGHWDFIVDYGTHGVTFHLGGMLAKEKEMKKWIEEIAGNYSERGNGGSSPNTFATRLGQIHMPYRRQESIYARFEGHPVLSSLQIKTTEIHKAEPKDEGLIERFAAAVGTGYAAGVDVKKIKSGSRMLAGLSGEELVLNIDDGNRDRLNFLWRYAGDKDSGLKPKIVLDMENGPNDLEQKLKLWDSILISVRAND